jgi:hypothetical protein
LPFSSLTECDRLCDRFGQGRPAAMPGIVGGYLMKHLKLKSFGLAMMLLLASFPAPVREAEGASSSTKAELAYISGSSTSAWLITGDTVKVRETKSEDYNALDLNVTYNPQGQQFIPLPDAVRQKIATDSPGSPADATRIITFTADADFNPAYSETDYNPTIDPETVAAMGHYAINGRYSAISNAGIVLETEQGTNAPTSQGSATIVPAVPESPQDHPITSTSSITFECIQEETIAGSPNFKIVGDSTGVFQYYKAGADDAGNPKTKISVIQDRVLGSQIQSGKIQLNLFAGDKNIGLVIDVKSAHTHIVTSDANGNILVKDNLGNTLTEGTHYTAGNESSPDNLIREGTTFTVNYYVPESNYLFLDIMTPQYAIQQIEKQIGGTSSGGTSVPEYIKLAEGDYTDYINKKFSLLTSTTQYNGEFRIEWEWEPEIPSTLPANVTEQDYKNLIQPPNSARTGLQEITFGKRLEDDVKGKLVAKVKYKKPKTTEYLYTNTGKKADGSYDTSLLPTIEIIVRGEGKRGFVTKESELKGTLTTTPEVKSYVTAENPNGEKLAKSSAQSLDAFTGGIGSLSPNKLPKAPYEFNLRLNMGAKNGAAEYAVATISGDNPEAISLKINNIDSYNSGDEIKNEAYVPNSENLNPGIVSLKVTAQPCEGDRRETRKATLTIEFYIPQRDGPPKADPDDTITINFTIDDSTPSQNSLLESLEIRDKDGKPIEGLEYTFSPEQKEYIEQNKTEIHIPYRVKQITFIPTVQNSYGTELNRMSVMRQTVGGVPEKECAGQAVDTGVESGITLRNGVKTISFDFTGLTENNDSDDRVGRVSQFVFTVPSEDPRTQYWSTYTLDIIRDPASDDSSLKGIQIYAEDDEKLENNLLANFSPDQREYHLEVPYSTDMLRVSADVNHKYATLKYVPEREARVLFGEKVWVKDLKKKFEAAQEQGYVDLEFIVTAEDGTGADKPYIVHLTRALPKTDATLKGLTVTDKDEQSLTYSPAFKADTDTYTMDVPYSIGEIKLNLAVNDSSIDNVQIYNLKYEGSPLFDLKAKKGIKLDTNQNVISDAISILPINDDAIREKGYHSIFIVVTAQDEKTQRVYELRVKRDIPSSDALLKSLAMQDQDAKPIKTLAFHPDEMEYVLNVPYETTQVNFTPTANDPGAKISIKEDGLLSSFISYDIESGATSKFFALKDPGEEKRFDIVVTAEDGKTSKTYTVRVVRELPSNDARLKALKVDNAIDFAPLFIASKNKYTATVAEGAQGVIITATANHPGATIRIDGNVVESGKPSDLIELLEIKQKVKIEVIAQDGVTRKIYVIEFTNQNLIEKTNNADLRRLEVNDGLMTPNFKSAVTEYEVTATEKTYSVDIVPKADDSLATIRVLNGTREIGDYNGNYSLALVDGENPITVEVTSPDKSVVKEYNITIFRNVEEKLKTLEPLEAEDIDYENSDNPILVKIEEYPRIGASVFNELKNYPEKSIIFQGNDYSLRFDADNLNTVIPQAEIYDFRMSFTSPDEDDIYAIIGEYEANDDIIDNVVMAYFTYHGSLPGPAAFRLSLGTKYGSRTLYWHYYNQERDRIDYYGTVKSNNKGNFGVVIDHFSTYLISPKHRLAGSEDKRGVVDELGMVLEEDYELIESGGKVNPNTGEEGGRS